jgi:anti-sigma factor ChrR (cupin superfamily)
VSAKKAKPSRPAGDDLLAPDASLSEATAQLAWAVPAVEPPSPRVKEALLARVRAAKAAAAPAVAGGKAAVPAGWRFEALATSEGWLPLRIPGVKMREVTVDRERDTALLYVEMAPGSIFPEHVHSAPERGLVLTGDFKTDQQLLHAGDFYEADAGTPHVRISSPSGCTGLLWVSAKAWQQWRTVMAAR